MEKLITREKFIGAFIKTFMLTTRKKVSELAKELDLSRATVVRLLDGEDVKLSTLFAVCRHLEIDMTDLFDKKKALMSSGGFAVASANSLKELLEVKSKIEKYILIGSELYTMTD